VIAKSEKAKPFYRELTRMSADRAENLYHRGHEGTQKENLFTAKDAEDAKIEKKNLPLMSTDDTHWGDCFPILLRVSVPPW
jgi:hypothetical protein